MKKIKLIIFGIIAVLLLGFGVYFVIASSQSSVKMKILYTSVFKTKPDDSKADFDGVHTFLQSGNSENTDYIFSIFQKDSETKQNGWPNSDSSETTESSGTIAVDANTVAGRVDAMLAEMGYTAEMRAGIMGNIEHESGMLYGCLQTGRHEDHSNYTTAQVRSWRGSASASGKAIGLCQWDSGRRESLLDDADTNYNGKWASPEPQLSKLKQELLDDNSYHCSLRTMQSAFESSGLSSSDAVEFYTYYFAAYFERCRNSTYSSGGHNLRKPYSRRTEFSGWSARIQNARSYYSSN